MASSALIKLEVMEGEACGSLEVSREDKSCSADWECLEHRWRRGQAGGESAQEEEYMRIKERPAADPKEGSRLRCGRKDENQGRQPKGSA